MLLQKRGQFGVLCGVRSPAIAEAGADLQAGVVRTAIVSAIAARALAAPIDGVPQRASAAVRAARRKPWLNVSVATLLMFTLIIIDHYQAAEKGTAACSLSLISPWSGGED